MMVYPVGWKAEVVVPYHSKTRIPTPFDIQISVLGLSMYDTMEVPEVSSDGWQNGGGEGGGSRNPTAEPMLWCAT